MKSLKKLICQVFLKMKSLMTPLIQPMNIMGVDIIPKKMLYKHKVHKDELECPRCGYDHSKDYIYHRFMLSGNEWSYNDICSFCGNFLIIRTTTGNFLKVYTNGKRNKSKSV